MSDAMRQGSHSNVSNALHPYGRGDPPVWDPNRGGGVPPFSRPLHMRANGQTEPRPVAAPLLSRTTREQPFIGVSPPGGSAAMGWAQACRPEQARCPLMGSCHRGVSQRWANSGRPDRKNCHPRVDGSPSRATNLPRSYSECGHRCGSQLIRPAGVMAAVTEG